MTRLYGLLWRAYPASQRSSEARAEAEQVVRDAVADTAGRPLGRLRLLLSLVADVVACRREEKRARLAGLRNGARPSGFVDALRQDVRFGVRALLRSPGFTSVAVVVLALGIGANATIFTLVDRLFVEPPPHVEEPERLVRINRAQEERLYGALAYPDFVHYRENTRTLEDVYAYDPDGIALTMGVGEARWGVRGWFVTDNYFDVLGATPAVGRTFTPAENATPGTHPVVVLSHGLWQRAFGGESEAIGSSVVLNGKPFTVVGVAPRGFRGASPIETPPDLWVPVMTQPLLAPLAGNYALERVPGSTWVWLYGVGRLAPGATVEQAQAEHDAMASHLEETFPEWNEGWGATVTRHYRFHPPDRSGLLQVSRLLFVVVGLLLVIACANIAILLLARASTRRRETGVRVALGAGRGRVVRQLLTESLLLASAGGAAGFGVAWLGSRVAAHWMPTTFAVDPSPRAIVFVFALLLAGVVALASGIVPAWQAARVDITSTLHGGGVGSGRSFSRSGLVVLQVALSVVLITGAVLFARSLQSARAVDLGFELDDRLVVTVNLRNHDYTEDEGQRFAEQALEQLRAQPGINRATTSLMVPFRGTAMTSMRPEDFESEEGKEPFSGFNVVSSDYFATMGIPIVRGREFGPRDSSTAAGVMVVNEQFAERFWPGESAIGKTVDWDEERPPSTVVGVAADATYYDLGEEPTLQMYFPLQQFYFPQQRFILEAQGSARALLPSVRSTLLGLDPDLAIAQVQTLDEAFAGEIGKFRTAASLVSLFGVLALILAVVGLYGVLSYLVVQRTREIGIRVALGATHRRVSRLVIGRGLRLALVGIVLGVGAAVLASRSVTGFLFGIEVTDAVTWVGVPLTLLAVAWLASLLPALRASRVDPVRAIRSE